jgi:pyruvate/2-oxoglutarate/acetoin dehydrogenase E1 component
LTDEEFDKMSASVYAELDEVTKRAIVLDEGPVTGGMSAELAALIQENLFAELKGPVVRIAAQPIPPPHSPPLVDAMIPDVDQIIEAVMRLAEGGNVF